MMIEGDEIFVDMDNLLQLSTDSVHSSLHCKEESHEISDIHQECSGVSPEWATLRCPERERNTPKPLVHSDLENP